MNDASVFTETDVVDDAPRPSIGVHSCARARRPSSVSNRTGIWRSIVQLNRRIARALTPVHVHEANVFGMYRKLGALLLSHPEVSRVADIGAGSNWHFPDHYKEWYNIHLVGIDIDCFEMATNEVLDEKVVCDVCDVIPWTHDRFDMIMVSSGIEHFSNNERFLDNAAQLLRPGGFFIAQFPGRFAPFALVNAFLSRNVSWLLLKAIMGEDAAHLGYRAHYDRTNYTAFTKLAEQAGLFPVYHSPGYYSSTYAEFFLPLWALSYSYDMLRFALGWRDLASYNLFILQKPDKAGAAGFEFHAWNNLRSVKARSSAPKTLEDGVASKLYGPRDERAEGVHKHLLRQGGRRSRTRVDDEEKTTRLVGVDSMDIEEGHPKLPTGT